MDFPEANIKFVFSTAEISNAIFNFEQSDFDTAEKFAFDFVKRIPEVKNGELLVGSAEMIDSDEILPTFVERKLGEFRKDGDVFFIMSHGYVFNMSQANRDAAARIYLLISNRR